MRSRWVIGGVAFLLAGGISGCSSKEPLHTLTGPTMGTTYTVKYLEGESHASETEVRALIEAVLAEINRQFSTYDSQSELSTLNRAPAAEWVPVSADVLTLMRHAFRLGDLSGGAFDLTVGPLLALWGFGPGGGKDRIPTDAEIGKARQEVGQDLLELRDTPASVRKRSAGVNVDLNSLAPGFAADEVAARLDGAGFTDYLVDMGGEFRLKGSNAKGEPWAIAIEKPAAGERSVERVLRITNAGLSTSGDYRNFFELNGKRYSHEIDVRSGRPIESRLASVTVIAPTAMEADGWATALLVLGPEAGYALAQKEGLAALFILRKGEGWEEQSSAAFRQYETPER